MSQAASHVPEKHSISVIIPAYNRAGLIGETLRSLFNQTLPAKEIIVVDDGSTDGTVEATEAEFSVFSGQFSGNSKFKIPTLKIIRQANAGPGAARNRGLAEATGEFIHFFDSDDIAAPNKHEVQLKALLETGADIAYGPWVKGRFGNLTTENTESIEDWFGGKRGSAWTIQAGAVFSNPSTSELILDSENTSLNRSVMEPADRLSSFRFQLSGFSPEGPVLQALGLPKGNLIKALLTNWSIVPHACLFRRSILEKVGGFPEDIWIGEDQLLFLRCLLAGAKVVHTPGTMVFYRLGEEGKLTKSREGQRRRVVDWGKFLVKASVEVARLEVEEIITTEDTENTEEEAGLRLASQAGPACAEALESRPSMLDNSPPWFGFRLRAYEAGRDLLQMPDRNRDLENGLEGIWRRSRFSGLCFQISGFLLRKWGGLKQKLVGHRWSRAFRCGRAYSGLLEEAMQK